MTSKRDVVPPLGCPTLLNIFFCYFSHLSRNSASSRRETFYYTLPKSVSRCSTSYLPTGPALWWTCCGAAGPRPPKGRSAPWQCPPGPRPGWTLWRGPQWGPRPALTARRNLSILPLVNWARWGLNEIWNKVATRPWLAFQAKAIVKSVPSWLERNFLNWAVLIWISSDLEENGVSKSTTYKRVHYIVLDSMEVGVAPAICPCIFGTGEYSISTGAARPDLYLLM